VQTFEAMREFLEVSGTTTAANGGLVLEERKPKRSKAKKRGSESVY
jgi:hypothetical protein